jgi:multidrug efflux pump
MGFNLSEWALRNRQIVLFLMLLAIVGALSYTKLGQSEDPPFTFKAMVIRPTGRGRPRRKSRGRSPSASKRN